MKPFNSLAAAVLVSLMGVPALAAAAADLALTDLSSGDRVRLRLSSGGKTVHGTVDAAGPDEVVVRPKDIARPLLRLSPQQLEKLEVVSGRRSRWREGAVIGFVPGAVFMGFMVLALDDCYSDCDDNTVGVVGYGLVGGAITGGLGALIGLAVKTDRWAPVATGRPKVALNLAPMKGGFQANLSLRF
jgi:hypothetical protein